ncbi:hypothetical protein ARMSODRAFT_979037 [Armillaria solidipes]|uniref:Uncharacterized protein n=1 Tax=Armillaria solidipes TaxID=1076256 RepID=A0A2H3B6K8_9AGAR|nr:hypothetical protein ARMSODRAFT_979037 [Armillaria solidipes]
MLFLAENDSSFLYHSSMSIGVPGRDARFAWTFDNLPSSELPSFHTSRGKIKSTFVSSEHNDQSSRLRNGTPKDPNTSTGDTGAACKRHTFPAYFHHRVHRFDDSSVNRTGTPIRRPPCFPLSRPSFLQAHPATATAAETLLECCSLDKKKRDGRVTCSSPILKIPLATNAVSSSGLVFRA